MNRRFVVAIVLFLALGSVRAEQVAPREIWPQAASAALNGDVDSAIKKTNELIETGRSFGLRTYPIYAASAAGLARHADKQGTRDVGQWAAKAADQLDPRASAVAFSNADRARDQRNWGRAIPMAVTGLVRVFYDYRSRLLSRCDLLIVASISLLITAALFAIALFIRYGRSMAHDFRETLVQRVRGGAVSVMAFALLFLPFFLWLGPMWLVFYWFVIFFGYANIAERIFIIVLALLVAGLPTAADRNAAWIAGVDSPVVMSAIAGSEHSYQPEALRRMQDLVGIVSDSATMHLLLGNLQLNEGNEAQAAIHYQRAVELNDSAGAHVNLGNLHFLDNDFAAAMTEYGKAEKLDPRLAIAFYNHSVASGETYKFDEQGQMLEQAKKIDRAYIERLAQNPPPQKIVIYNPTIAEAWQVEETTARRGVARTLFGNYSYFDPLQGTVNPVTIGGILTVILSVVVWIRRRKRGFAGACIKCGRTFCHRCKSARESATYCTQCIHIYLKRDGVSLDTKRTKLEEVHEHQTGMQKRNKIVATFVPGSAQLLEGRTAAGLLGMFIFLLFVAVAVYVGRLAPAIGPVAETAKLLVRLLAIILAVAIWLMLSLPVYRRRAVA